MSSSYSEYRRFFHRRCYTVVTPTVLGHLCPHCETITDDLAVRRQRRVH